MIWGCHYFRKHPFLFQVIQNEVLSKETPKEEKTKKDDSDSSDEKPKKKTSDSHGPQIFKKSPTYPWNIPKRPEILPVYEGNPFIFVFWDTWGMGVCWDFLRQMSSLFLFFSHLFRRRKLAILWGLMWWFFESIFTVQKSKWVFPEMVAFPQKSTPSADHFL